MGLLLSRHRPFLISAVDDTALHQHRGHLPGVIELEGPAAQVEVSATLPILVTMEGMVVDEDITGILLLVPEHQPLRTTLVIVRMF